MKKKIAFITIPIVLLVSILSICLFIYNRPINRVKRAFEKKNYKAVVSLYNELKDKEDKQYTKKKLAKVAMGYYDRYYEEKITYEETSSFFAMVTKKVLKDNDEVVAKQAEIEIIKSSRDDYNKAIEAMEKGDYLAAIMSFYGVSVIDKKYYASAEEKLKKCSELYCDEVLKKADEFIAQNDYVHAKQAIEIAIGRCHDERLPKKLDEILAFMNIDIDAIWKVKYDFGDLIASALGVKKYDVYFPIELVFIVEKTHISVNVSRDSIRPALDELTSDPDSMDALYSVAKKYGLSKSAADVLITLTYGGSYTDFIMDRFSSEIDDALEEISLDANCYVDPEKIYLRASSPNTTNYLVYEEQENKLIFKEFVGKDKLLSLLEYPLELTR